MHYVLLLFLKRQSPECITHLNQIKPSHKRKQDTFKLHLHSNESPWEVFLFVAADTFTLTNPCGCSPNPQPIPTYAETSDTRGHERMCFLVWPGRWPGAGQSGRGAGIWRRYLLRWERLPACCASSSVLPLLLRSWEREGRGEKKVKQEQEQQLITGQRYSFQSAEQASREIELSQRSVLAFPASFDLRLQRKRLCSEGTLEKRKIVLFT